MQSSIHESKITRQDNRRNEHDIGLFLSASEKIKNNLAKIIIKAKRSGVWRKLEEISRSLLSLSSKLEIRFRSISLLRAIVKIVKEIAELSSFTYSNYMLGIKMAYRLAEYAVNCGYKEAAEWLNDRNFTIFLGISINHYTYTK